jgi:ATP-binding cassette subfamily B protein/subfamily B ATP-binding cassette protein MsbA
MAGFLYLQYIVITILADVIGRASVIVDGDAATTAKNIIAAALQFLVVLAYMIHQSWQLALITLLPLPFIGLITSWWSRRSEPKWRESSEAASALNALLHDNLTGIRQIKAYTVEPEALDHFDSASRKVGEKHMDIMKGQSIVWPAVSLIAESGIILMVAFGAWWAVEGRITPGVVMSFLVAWGFLFDPVSRINGLAQTFTRGVVAAERVFAIIDTPDESNLRDGLKLESFQGGVRFKNVGFSYGSEAPTVSEITLHAAPGQTIALVGPTGAGKSTILNLLTRFYEADTGVILLDDQPIDGLSKEWLRDNTGYVTQESFLFNTSIRENMKLANRDAGDDQIWQALESANAAGFVTATTATHGFGERDQKSFNHFFCLTLNTGADGADVTRRLLFVEIRLST